MNLKARHKKQLTVRALKARSFKRRGTILFIVVILANLSAFLFGIHNSHKSVVGNNKPKFGLIPGRLLDEPDKRQLADLKKLKQLGVSELRFQLDWSTIESSKGKYNWVATDRVIKNIKISKLSMVLQLGETPAWARLQACKETRFCAPEDKASFAKFAATAASRYKQDPIIGWEIWNEENSFNFWKPYPDAQSYTELLKLSYVAIKKQNPAAVVLVGGLSGDATDTIGRGFIDPRTFLTNMYLNGAKQYFDTLGYHPYIAKYGLANSSDPFNGWAKMTNTRTSIRSVMSSNGDANKGIWITEFGIPTGGSGIAVSNPKQTPIKNADHVTLSAESQIVNSIMNSVKNKPWIQHFDWYTYKDDPGAQQIKSNAYGLLQSNGTPKPILKILQANLSP